MSGGGIIKSIIMIKILSTNRERERESKRPAGISRYLFGTVVFLTLLFGFFQTITPVFAATLLSDDFTGTTINTSKWTEIDASGAGGTSGEVQQNGTLTIANSYVANTWGATAMISADTFNSTGLEISALMTRASDQLLSYGDYNFQSAGTKAYIVDLTSSVLALSWENGSLVGNTSCGAYSAGATYKMVIISGGFEVYKNNSLICTHNTSVTITDKPIFLESSLAASNYDDVLVVETPPVPTAPDAPTIGTATAGNGQATVTFTPPASNGGSAITGYTATSLPGSITGTGSSSPITVTGLTNGTAYTFTVTATNAVGTSPASSASNSVTPSVPAVPDQVAGVSVTGVNKQVLIGWDAPGQGGAAITDYLVEYKTSSSSTWITFSDGTSSNTKTIVTGLANGTAYDFRVSAINSGGTGTASATSTATPNAISTLAFVFTGESNSGGIGLNSDATAGELATRSSVQIMNLTSGLFLFENLDIGTNNLRDHAGLESYYDNSHGFELQLANSTEANAFPDNSQVYLVKTGQGGSQVSQWNVGGTYWTKFLERTAATKTQVPTGRQWVVWMSLGINDSIAGVPTSTWKTSMVAHIDKIKTDLPGAIIILTQFQSMGYASYNTIMSEIAAEEPNVYVVDSTGAALRDSNHWSYSGLKTVGASMVTITNNALGLIYPGKPTTVTPTESNGQVSLSWTAPVSNGGSAITDYLVEYKTTAGSTWLTFADGVSTGTSATVTGLTNETSYDFRVSTVNTNGTGNPSSIATAITPDVTAPTITNISSDKIDGSYTTGEVIDIDVTFSEAVTSTGNVTVTLETGTTDRSCTFTVSNATTGTCNYTVQAGDTTSDLDATISGTIADQASNLLTNFASATSLATNKAIVIDTIAPVRSAGLPSGSQPAGTTQVTLSLTTDENATCKYSTTAGTAYGSMTAFSTTGATSHSVTISGLSNGNSYNYYVRCIDGATNANSDDYTISFSIASPVSSGGGGGGGGFFAPYPTAPAGGFTATRDITNSQSKTVLHFGFGNDITNIAISDNINFTPATYINATSSVEWTATTTKILYIKYCNRYGRCSNPISLQINAFVPIVSNSYKFYKNLSYRMTNSDVKELQKYLNTHGVIVAPSGAGSLGKETNYFGLLTYRAVVKFQEAHASDILTPNGLKKGTGYFGPSTRAFVNK